MIIGFKGYTVEHRNEMLYFVEQLGGYIQVIEGDVEIEGEILNGVEYDLYSISTDRTVERFIDKMSKVDCLSIYRK